MIATVIVLFVIALALGGYIAFDVFYGRRGAAMATFDAGEEVAASKRAEQDGRSVSGAQTAEVLAEAPQEKQIERMAQGPSDDGALSGGVFKPSEVRAEVKATEVDRLMTDEVAASLIEKSESNADRTKRGIINIDTLSQVFESGDVVTLDEIKKRVKGFNRNTTYIKVLARGAIDKPLTVEADSFSLQAVKMIVLTGGKAIKKN